MPSHRYFCKFQLPSMLSTVSCGYALCGVDAEAGKRFYLIGSDRNKRFFRVLKIDRSELSDLNISEDLVVYSPKEIKNLLQRIDVSGLPFISERVFVVLGQVVDPFYLLWPVGCGLYQMGQTLFYG